MLHELLERNVPRTLVRRLLSVVETAYRQTHREVQARYERAEASDVEPHIRRANIETAFLQLGRRFSPGIRVEQGETQNGNFFRYIVCNDVVMTESYVEPGRRVPREALFRNKFAGDPNQLLLFPDAEADRQRQHCDRERQYVILTHTPSPDDPSVPAYVAFVLVDADCKYSERVNLAEYLAATPVETAEPERIPDQLVARLRKEVRRRETRA